ncbi:hypothetical protein [Caulobacter sp.]|uniref:hypothetical protein n=1 Tax=Caulobacter sp. TaxID=78 RepID=UPI003BA8C7A0
MAAFGLAALAFGVAALAWEEAPLPLETDAALGLEGVFAVAMLVLPASFLLVRSASGEHGLPLAAIIA